MTKNSQKISGGDLIFDQSDFFAFSLIGRISIYPRRSIAGLSHLRELYHRTPYHRFQLLRRGFARVVQIYLMVTATRAGLAYFAYIDGISIISDKLYDCGVCARFVIIRADVHCLNAKPFGEFPSRAHEVSRICIPRLCSGCPCRPP